MPLDEETHGSATEIDRSMGVFAEIAEHFFDFILLVKRADAINGPAVVAGDKNDGIAVHGGAVRSDFISEASGLDAHERDIFLGEVFYVGTGERITDAGQKIFQGGGGDAVEAGADDDGAEGGIGLGERGLEEGVGADVLLGGIHEQPRASGNRNLERGLVQGAGGGGESGQDQRQQEEA